jgi:hypothetical protein
MNCAFLCRSFLLLMMLVLPFGCEDAGNEELTTEEESEIEQHASSEEYQGYATGTAGTGSHAGGAGGHGGGSTPPQ